MEFGAYEWFYSNVGVADISGSDGYEWVYSNGNTNQPDPFILGCTPVRARTGDSVEALVRGAGETANQYIPRLQGQLTDGSWASIPISNLTYVPPTSNAYNSNRAISESLDIVDVSHTRLTFAIPNWAASPNLPLRVTTSDTGTAGYLDRDARETFYSNITS